MGVLPRHLAFFATQAGAGGSIQDLDPVTPERLDFAESWGWRLVMPALLYGGTAVGWVLIFVLGCRITNWLGFHRSESGQWRTGSGWWLAYYAALALGGAWSADLGSWAWNLEVKSALWFFPVVAAIPGRRFSSDFWWSVGWSVVLYFTWRLLLAGWTEFVLGKPGKWTYAGFSGDVHPTYLGLHAAVALIGLGKEWARNVGRTGCGLLTVLLAVSIGLTGSKAGILAALLVALLGLAMMWLGTRNEAGRQWAASLPLNGMCWMLFVAVLTFAAFGASKARFAEMETAAEAIASEQVVVNSSSAGRVAVWRTSWEILREYPFGVGTGDVESELMQRYASKGLRYAADRKLNPHNQWLQVGVALGWPGILVFTLAMLSVFRWAYRERQGLALLCAILVMFHAAFESVFEVQRGVVFILWMLMALAPIFRRDRAVQHR